MTQKLFYLLLIVCWLGTATVAQAQADFRPGYIVPLSGDTVRGLADYRGSARSAELCRFRPAPDAEIVSYNPVQIRGYGFQNGRHYSSQHLVPIDSVQYEYAPPPQSVFMEVLAAGSLILYSTRSKTGTDRYFVALANTSKIELLELIPQRPDEARLVTRAYRRAPLYRGVLTKLFDSCPTVNTQVATLPFTANALVGIVQRYNACQTPASTTTKGTSVAVAAKPIAGAANQRIRLGLIIGAETSHFTVSGPVYLANGHFTSNLLPVVGLGLAIPFASLSEKLSLHIEALAEQQRYDDTFMGGKAYGNTHYRLHLTMAYLRLPILVRYTYPTGRFRPFVQAGLCYAQRLHFDMKTQQGLPNSAGMVEFEAAVPLESVVEGIVNYEIGLVGGLGMHLPTIAGHALTLEARVENSSGFIITSGTSSSNLRYLALLGYNFTK